MMGGEGIDPFADPLLERVCQNPGGGILSGTVSEYVLLSWNLYLGTYSGRRRL